MSITEIPETSRFKGYDYGAGSWRSVAVQTSGEVKVARGETLLTYQTVYATAASGGTMLASGPVEHVHVRVPEMKCSGDNNLLAYQNSGFAYGIMLGGKSGNEPYTANFLSGEPWCVTSGKGIWLPVGSQKDLHVQNLNEIYVCGEQSGYPVTFVAEVIA